MAQRVFEGVEVGHHHERKTFMLFLQELHVFDPVPLGILQRVVG